MNYRLLLAAAALALLSLSTPNCTGTGQGYVTRDCGGQLLAEPRSKLCAYTRYDNAGTEIETVFCDVTDETCNGNPFGFPLPGKTK